MTTREIEVRRNSRRTALVLTALALLFFAGVIVKYQWLMQ
jgi:hypothetical protein